MGRGQGRHPLTSIGSGGGSRAPFPEQVPQSCLAGASLGQGAPRTPKSQPTVVPSPKSQPGSSGAGRWCPLQATGPYSTHSGGTWQGGQAQGLGLGILAPQPKSQSPNLGLLQWASLLPLSDTLAPHSAGSPVWGPRVGCPWSQLQVACGLGLLGNSDGFWRQTWFLPQAAVAGQGERAQGNLSRALSPAAQGGVSTGCTGAPC